MADSNKRKRNTTNKKTRTNKKGTRKKPSQSSRRNNKKTGLLSSTSHLREIILLVLLLVSIYLLISLYFDLGGKIGQVLSGLIFGFFGIAGYLIPLFLVVFIAYKLFIKESKGNILANNKFMVSFIFIIIASISSHIYYVQSSQLSADTLGSGIFFKVINLYYSMSKVNKTFGGIVGGLLGDGLVMLLGKVGTVLFLAFISVILIILITERSFVRLIKYIASKIKSHGKNVNQKLADKKNERKNRKRKIVDETFERIVEKEELEKEKEFEKDYDNTIVENGVVHWDFPSVDDVMKEEEPYEVISEIHTDEEAKPVEKAGKQQNDSKAEETEIEEKDVEKEIKDNKAKSKKESEYEFPPIKFLNTSKGGKKTSRFETEMKAEKLVETLKSFGVGVSLLDMKIGPSVTRYELQPDIGVKVSKIVNLQDDIALSLAASGIRIEAPIPGKSAIGIEVPNDSSSNVYLRNVIESNKFKSHPSVLTVALGVDIAGEAIVADIAKMPHLLIAGATGSGKSVCINTIIVSLLYKASPDEVKLIMIDPKVVELKVYNEIPHLMIPVVTDPKKASLSLNWGVHEMNERYKIFAEYNVRDLNGYNMYVEEYNSNLSEGDEKLEKKERVVIIIDELADLMMSAPGEVETAIIRLAQMGRAAGIHLIIATQRPSVNVITGLIKANVPSRIAFNVSSGVDSRTIIDGVGAEKLLGKGDMLFSPVGTKKPIRVQGAFVSDAEVNKIVNFLKEEKKQYNDTVINKINKGGSGGSAKNAEHDEYFDDAVRLVIEKKKASASMLQRYFRVGYNRAARIMDQLTEMGIVSGDEGSKAREVLVTLEQYENMMNGGNADEK